MRWIEKKLSPLVIAAALASGGVASAQTVAGETGVIEGVVVDATGAGLAGINVAVRGAGIDRGLQTRPEGSYTVVGLPSGSYSVEVWAEGFSSAIAEDIGLDSGETLRLDFELAPGSGIAITVIASPRIDVASSARFDRLDEDRTDLYPSRLRFSQAARLSAAITELPSLPTGLEIGRESLPRVELRGSPLAASSALADGVAVGGDAAPPLELDAAVVEHRILGIATGGQRPIFAGSPGGRVLLSAAGRRSAGADEPDGRWRFVLDLDALVEDVSDPASEGTLLGGRVDREQSGARDLTASLGGSAGEGRFRLFAAVASRRFDLEQRLADGAGVSEALDERSGTLRFEGVPTARLRLALTASRAQIEGDGLLSDAALLSASAGEVPTEVSGQRESRRVAATFDLGATDRLHLHAWAGRLDRARRDPFDAGDRWLSLTSSRGLDLGADFASDAGFATGKPGFAESSDLERDALRLQATWAVGAGHRLTLGGELESDGVELRRGLEGARTEVLWGSEAPGVLGTRYDLSASLQGAIERDRRALYVEDEWRLSRRLTLQLGLRAESDRVSAVGSAPAGGPRSIDRELGDAFEPRLGLAWDVLGDGNYVIYLTADRFHRPLADALAVAALGSARHSRSFGRFDAAADLLVAPATATALSGLTAPIVVDPALEAERWDQVAVGTEQLIVPGLSVRAEASYRQLDRGVGLVFVDEASVADGSGDPGVQVPVLANPGLGLARRPYGPAGPEHPGAKARRLWLEMSADVRLGRRWTAGAGYAYTEGEGNADGASSPFETSASLAAFGAGAGSADLLPAPACAWLEACFGADGSSTGDRLLGDRRHRWKLYGSLALRRGLDLSAYLQYASGVSPTPRIGVLSEHEGALAAVGPVAVPGIDDGGVGDAISQLDLEASWRLAVGPFAGEGRELSLFLLVNNVFDQDKPLTRWNRLTLEPVVVPRDRLFAGFDALALADAQGIARDPRFGQPRLVQRPREARLGLRLAF